MEEQVFHVLLSTKYNMRRENLFIVWSCYILGNRKYLIGVKDTESYFEITYNDNKKEWYIDEYIKLNNTCVSNKNLGY